MLVSHLSYGSLYAELDNKHIPGRGTFVYVNALNPLSRLF